jgi:hypothetical protein
MHLKEEVKQAIVENCKNNKYESFGSYKVKRIETIDGWKFKSSRKKHYLGKINLTTKKGSFKN